MNGCFKCGRSLFHSVPYGVPHGAEVQCTGCGIGFDPGVLWCLGLLDDWGRRRLGPMYSKTSDGGGGA